MKRLILILFIFLSFLHVSCESFFAWPEDETETYLISGNISFEYSDLDSLLPNTIVTVWDKHLGGCLGCPSYDYYLLGSDTIDATGNYSINLVAKKDNLLNLCISAKNAKSIKSKYTDIPKIPNQNIDIQLKPNAYLKLNISRGDTPIFYQRYIKLNFTTQDQNPLAFLTYESTPSIKPIIEVVGSETTIINYNSNIFNSNTYYSFTNMFDTTEINFTY